MQQKVVFIHEGDRGTFQSTKTKKIKQKWDRQGAKGGGSGVGGQGRGVRMERESGRRRGVEEEIEKGGNQVWNKVKGFVLAMKK